jgi:type I restriction enzyme, S subunit
LGYAAATNQACAAFLPSEKCVEDYLYYFLLYKKQDIIKLSVGGAQPNISAGIIKDISIPLPSIPEQKRIAQLLDAADALRQKDKAILEKYDALAQSLFLEMFGDPVRNEKGWEVKSIDSFTKLVKGITYNPNEVQKEGILVLRSSNVQNGELDLMSQVRISKNVDCKFFVQKNDLLMCNRNGSAHLVGKVARIPDADENMTFGTFMTVIRTDFYQYLYYFMHTTSFRTQIRMQTSVAINQVSLPLLANVNVPLPPISLQNQFAERIQKIEQQKGLAKQNLAKSEELFKVLLERSFG